MKAVILCGGFGTRLGELTLRTPKPMLTVAGRPFIAHVLDKLCGTEIDSTVLAVGFEWEQIKLYVGNRWGNMTIDYSVESTPLGTGGAALLAMKNQDLSEAIVLNGDTLFDIDIQAFIDRAKKEVLESATTVLALRIFDNCSRYGCVEIDKHGIIQSFGEKGYSGPGLINAGIYLQQRAALERFNNTPFSFETDYLAIDFQNLKIVGIPSSGYFIDIGIPEDLNRAETEISSTLSR